MTTAPAVPTPSLPRVGVPFVLPAVLDLIAHGQIRVNFITLTAGSVGCLQALRCEAARHGQRREWETDAGGVRLPSLRTGCLCVRRNWCRFFRRRPQVCKIVL